MMAESLCAFASGCLRGPAEEPYGGKFLVAEHHEEWGDLVGDNNRLCVLAPRDHSKCTIEGTLILKPDGTRVEVQDWKGGEVLAYNSETHKLEIDTATPSRKLPKEQCYRIKTRTGRSIGVNAEHQFKTLEKWVRADELQLKDRIAVTHPDVSIGSEVFWDEVIEIEDIGFQHIYGISVDRLKNYVANDIINHNTFFFDFAYPIWMAWKNPGKSGFIFSATADQAARILRDIREEIETNPKLAFLLPDRPKKWNDHEIQLANGHTIYARGFGTKVRGAHPIWVVCDDCLNDETAYSETVRRKQSDYFFSAISNMPIPGGQIIVVGCVTLDTWVNTKDGLRRIGDLCPGPLTPKTYYDYELDVYGRYGLKKTSKFWVNGKEKTKKITLRGGFSVEGTHRHPLLVMGKDGNPAYVRSDEIEVGDYVAIQVGADTWGKKKDLRPFKDKTKIDIPDEMNRELAYILGLAIAKDVYSLELFELLSFLGGKPNSVPQAIMEGDKESAESFLTGFLNGCLKSNSIELVKDLQQLLLNLNTLSFIEENEDSSFSLTLCEEGFDQGHIPNQDPVKLKEKEQGAKGPFTELLAKNIEESRQGRVWLQVRKIEDSEAETVDFVIPDGHSFLSNGIVSHNTPFSAADLYAELRERKAYTFRRYSAIKDDGSPLWRERYSLKLLKWKRDEEIGPLKFNREFLCLPMSDDVSLFPSYFFQGPVEMPNVKLGMPRKFWASLGLTIYIGVDFAISASTQADSTVIWVMGVDPRGNRWIIDIFKAKGMPYRVQKSKLIEYGKRYQPELIFLESNQMQRIFGDELILDTDLPIKKFMMTAEKHSLERGIPSLRTLLEAQKVKIPRGDERSVMLTNEWIAEMGLFMFEGGKVKSTSRHDDLSAAFYICDQAIRTGSQFSATWTDTDIYTQEELENIKNGRGHKSLDALLKEQTEKVKYEDKEDDLDYPSQFGSAIQIVAGEYDDLSGLADDPDEEVDDIFSGNVLTKVTDWRPKDKIPIPGAGGWWS